MSDGIMAVSIVEIDLAPALAKVFYPGGGVEDKELADRLVSRSLRSPRDILLRTALDALNGCKVATDDEGIHRMISAAVEIFGDIDTELMSADVRGKNSPECYWEHAVRNFEPMLTMAILTCFSDLEFEIYIAGYPPADRLN